MCGWRLLRVGTVATSILRVHGEASESVAEEGLSAIGNLSSDDANCTRLGQAGACAGVRSRLTGRSVERYVSGVVSAGCLWIGSKQLEGR